MNSSELQALKLLLNNAFSISELASKLGLSYSRTASIIRELVRKGYCEKQDGKIKIAKNVKTSLFKKLAHRYDVLTLFSGACEALLLVLNKPSDVSEIQKNTGLAQSTIYQGLRKLMAIGVVRRVRDQYALAEDQTLRDFLVFLKREREAVEIEHNAILLYSRNGIRLKKVPAGQEAAGSKTAFSLFPKYGLEYFSPYDYYVEPPKDVSIEECLLHALIVSENKAERTICALFYLKNADRIDDAKIKALAKKYGVSLLLMELQSYIKGPPYSNTDLFLPWVEFKEKAALYGVTIPLSPEREKFLSVLNMLGEKLDAVASAYLFGGANLMLRGLKSATKDIDLVVDDEESFLKLRNALLKLSFRMLSEKELTVTDKRLNPSGIFTAQELPRFDVFTKAICNAFMLSEDMKKRSEVKIFGKLKLHLISLEDVFLLKSITGRGGDLEDMAIIVRRTGSLDWNTVLETYFKQEKDIKRHLCFNMLDNVELLQEKEGIGIPIYNPLLRHCTDTAILQSVYRGATSVREIRVMIDIPEYTIRNRIVKLVKQGMLSKIKRGKRFTLKLTVKGRKALFLD
ncbi:MAG: helix-turn-helix domain-containing protein [Thermoproteota archaeon]|nr:ArsR family transcriptional regulator [Candidatus Brockarchaeota archaeon]